MIPQQEQIRIVRMSASWRLMIWSIASIVIGLIMWFAPMGNDHPRLEQFIRAAGLLHVRRALPDEAERQAGQKLIRAMKFNRWLNWLWIACGVALLLVGVINRSSALDGHGVGVLIQGDFCFIFDRTILARLLELRLS